VFGCVNIEPGFQATQQFIDDRWETRFLQSIKTFIASPRFTGTPIFSRQYEFEGLMESFFTCALNYAGTQWQPDLKHVVVGGTVTFVGHQLSITHKFCPDVCAQFDIDEWRQSFPHDHIAGRWIAGTGKITA